LTTPNGSCNFQVNVGPTDLTDLTDGFDNRVDVSYSPSGFPNLIDDFDTANCPVEPPAPGTIIIEKVTLGGTGTYGYTTTEGCDTALQPCGFPSFPLTTVLDGDTSGSLIDTTPVGPTNGFVSRTFTPVSVDPGGDTVYTVDETSLELGTTFVSLTCVDPTGDTTLVAGTQGALSKAIILLDSLETVACRFVNTFPDEGCTPGFWQGGFGMTLWDQGPPDSDWITAGGTPNNPFAHTTLFNDFFTPDSLLNGVTMLAIVGTGGGPIPTRKAARDVIAAYLNASFGLAFGFTPTQIADMWTAAVGNDVALQDLHILLAAANQQGCTITP
jgi:hypothetical protein